MSTPVKELIRWLESFEEDAVVGVDEGGLTLVVYKPKSARELAEEFNLTPMSKEMQEVNRLSIFLGAGKGDYNGHYEIGGLSDVNGMDD